MSKLERIVCAGIAWPTIIAPAYFCIFAQKEKENKFGKKPLIQVFELENLDDSIDRFFKEVKEASNRFGVDMIFGNAEESAFYEKAKSFDLFIPEKLTGMDNFSYGLTIITTWSRAHAIKTMKDSILRSQLSSLRESELKEAPEKYNAINGLRYLVTGFDDKEDGRPSSDSPLWGINLARALA